MILSFALTGRPLRGKSGMKTTRTGRHYPDAEWAAQRDAWVLVVKAAARKQYNGAAANGWTIKPLPFSCAVKLSGMIRFPDKRVADLDGVIGALGHVLERAGIIQNDKQIVSVAMTISALGTPATAGIWCQVETEFLRPV